MQVNVAFMSTLKNDDNVQKNGIMIECMQIVSGKSKSFFFTVKL